MGTRDIFNVESGTDTQKLSVAARGIDDIGAKYADIILRERTPRERATYVAAALLGLGVTAAVTAISRVAGILVFAGFVVAGHVFSKSDVRVPEDTENEKMMIRVLIARYGEDAFYLYRDSGILRSLFRAVSYISGSIDPHVGDSVIAFGKMMRYVILLERGYPGDTRELTYELDLLRREGFNALARYEFSTDPMTVVADDKTVMQLIEDLKPRVQSVMGYAQKLIRDTELSRISKSGINVRSNLMALGPWYSYKPCDIGEDDGLYL